MISPAFATMLCFVQTTRRWRETADLLLGVCVKRSFDRISVDGQLSTNDTAILMASTSGVIVQPESESEGLRFGEALDYLLRRLALLMVRDLARSQGRPRGRPRRPRAARRRGGPGGRQFAAREGGAARRRPELGPDRAGRRRAVHDTAPLPVDVWIEDTQVCAKGAVVPYDERALAAAVAGREVQYTVGLPGEGTEAEVFFSDLSHEYVTINAEYTT